MPRLRRESLDTQRQRLTQAARNGSRGAVPDAASSSSAKNALPCERVNNSSSRPDQVGSKNRGELLRELAAAERRQLQPLDRRQPLDLPKNWRSG